MSESTLWVQRSSYIHCCHLHSSGFESPIKVAFGTEAGLFAQHFNVPSVVCGPGSTDQGHKPDEYVELTQLQQCDAMFDRLLLHLERGIAST